MKKININRAKWRTGDTSKNATGYGDTCLRNDSDFRCCLGFICLQDSKNVLESITNIDYPQQLATYPKALKGNLINRAVEINDNNKTTPKQKESKLKKLFKNIYELNFYGEYEVV